MLAKYPALGDIFDHFMAETPDDQFDALFVPDGSPATAIFAWAMVVERLWREGCFPLAHRDGRVIEPRGLRLMLTPSHDRGKFDWVIRQDGREVYRNPYLTREGAEWLSAALKEELAPVPAETVASETPVSDAPLSQANEEEAPIDAAAVEIFNEHMRRAGLPADDQNSKTPVSRSDATKIGQRRGLSVPNARQAYRRVYETKPWKPIKAGWPLKEPFRTRSLELQANEGKNSEKDNG